MDKIRYPKLLIPKTKGQSHLSSTKQTACILMVCTQCSKDFYPNLPQFAALSGTSTPQLLPPQNGAIVRTYSVRTKAYLQNSETFMRNLHW